MKNTKFKSKSQAKSKTHDKVFFTKIQTKKTDLRTYNGKPKKQAQSKGRWAKTNHMATASKSMPHRGKIHTNRTMIVHKTTMGKLKTNMGTKFKISKMSPLIPYKPNVH